MGAGTGGLPPTQTTRPHAISPHRGGHATRRGTYDGARQAEEAKADVARLQDQVANAKVKLARLDELEAEAAGLRADLRLRQEDAQRSEEAASRLQVRFGWGKPRW